jgi:hypothetical protein
VARGGSEPLDPAVALPSVGDDLGARLDVIGDEGVPGGGGRIRQRGHTYAADPFGFAHLNRDAGQHLLALGAPAAQPRLLTADEGLIDLHDAGQPVPAGTHQHRTQPV